MIDSLFRTSKLQFVIVNGINSSRGKIANGLDCLAAQTVAHFKTEVGGFYLMRARTRNAGENYRYTVYAPDRIGEPHIKAENGYGKKWEILFDGPVSEFVGFVKKSGD